MEEQELAKRLKTNLEHVPGISNVKLHPGAFRGKEQKPAYLEYHLTSPEFEANSTRIYSFVQNRIRKQFPNALIEYIKPNTTNGTNLRRININIVNESLKPYEKEKLIKNIAQQFNNIIENYLLRK